MRPYTQDHVLNVTDQVSVGTDKGFNSFKYDAIGSIYGGRLDNVYDFVALPRRTPANV